MTSYLRRYPKPSDSNRTAACHTIADESVINSLKSKLFLRMNQLKSSGVLSAEMETSAHKACSLSFEQFQLNPKQTIAALRECFNKGALGSNLTLAFDELHNFDRTPMNPIEVDQILQAMSQVVNNVTANAFRSGGRA